jgi:multicomponent Na+:H+ antiporter subunit B
LKRIFAIAVLLVIFLFFVYSLSQGLLLYDNNSLTKKVSKGFIYKYSKSFPVQNQEPAYYGKSGYEEGSANIVTSIVVGYRAFDTLGEISVLFIAIAGVTSLFGKPKHSFEFLNEKPGFIIEMASKFLLPLIVLFGVYIIIHGHLSPGGGFQGGSIIATGVLMYYLAFYSHKENNIKFTFIETLSGFGYVLIGLASMVFMGTFLANFLNTGTIGNLISAGIIPVLYFLIGLKVSGELSSALLYFLDKE